MLAGDFNQLSTKSILERTGLISLVSQPTRGTSILDQILVSQPEYQKVQVLTSVVRSDHKCIVAYADPTKSAATKTTTQRTFRTKTPTQHALFLEHVSAELFDNPNPSTDVQEEFDFFYDKLLDLFNNYYPLRTITVSSRDPDYVTPAIKAKLRHKNRLMHVGRLDEADALAKQIAKDISKSIKSRLSNISLRRGPKVFGLLCAS